MLVKDRMTPNPVTITPETSFTDAFRIIHEKGLRYFPVLDKKGKLVGVVTQTDLLHASPSAATSLSVFEVNYLLANMPVKEVMSSPPITVTEDTPIEQAALIMVENRIACLPVMREETLVGIITETDIFRAFVEILTCYEATLRVTLRAPNVRGELARLTAKIARLGGDLCSVASFRSEDPDYVYFTFRLKGVEQEELIPALEAEDEHVVHVCKVNSCDVHPSRYSS